MAKDWRHGLYREDKWAREYEREQRRELKRAGLAQLVESPIVPGEASVQVRYPAPTKR